jgi:catechol 2,3-dioxygenase-like lactoylglutathione lyase family enzyme
MKLKQAVKICVLTSAILALASTTNAQLAAPNAEGVSAGHTHLVVPDLAKHRAIWKSFGGVEKNSGRIEFLQFPGMDILFREQAPTSPSGATSANHIAFSVKSYADYKAKLEAAGATFVIDNAETGQILADLPDGVRVEFVLDTEQAQPIVFHHTHLAAVDQAGLRDWYIKVFGAEVGERNGMPSAVVPGGRIDVLAARGEAPIPTQGSAIDHIGFEVADMAAFAAKMEKLGIEFNRAPERRDDINLTIAFITDPVGTYIEITEGLDEVK